MGRKLQIAAISALIAWSLPQVTVAGPPQQATDTVTPGSGVPMPKQAGPAKRAAVRSVDQRIKDLHKKLQITPAQEEQWSKVAAVMRENAAAMDALVKDGSARGGAIDQLHRYEILAQAHLDGVKKFTSAFASLYDSLSTEQRATADRLFRGRMGPPDRGPG